MRESTEFMELLAERIRDKRESMGWSLERLARATDLSKTGLWQIEKAKSMPEAGTILRLCYALGISPNKLLLGKEQFE